jgi:hypothetical protein
LHSLSLQQDGQSATILQGESISTIHAQSIHVFQPFGESKKNPPVATQNLLDNSPKDNYVYISSQIQNLVVQKHVDNGNPTTYLRTTEKEFEIDEDLDDSE